MTKQNAIWIPPSLCGCQLKMTAEFTEGSVVDGVSYRHPKPFTIIALDIVNVCAGHHPNTLTMIDTIGLFETDNYTGEMTQRRGYLSYPIASPTPAQCLYTFLAQYGGQTHSYPCGCKAHQFVDEKQNINYLPHPIHSKRCLKHKGDTHDMKHAAADFKAKMARDKS